MNIDLKSKISTMGYPNFFDKENARFGLSSDPSEFAYISNAKQLCKLILNNEGVEAAAMTVLTMENATSMP